MGFGDKQDNAVWDFVVPHLEQGESYGAVVGQVVTGPSLWGSLLSPATGIVNKPFGIAVTDRRVFLVRLARKLMGCPPAEVVAAFPIDQVTVERFEKGTFFGRLVLTMGADNPLEFRVQTVYRDAAEQVANAISRREPSRSLL